MNVPKTIKEVLKLPTYCYLPINYCFDVVDNVIGHYIKKPALFKFDEVFRRPGFHCCEIDFWWCGFSDFWCCEIWCCNPLSLSKGSKIPFLFFDSNQRFLDWQANVSKTFFFDGLQVAQFVILSWLTQIISLFVTGMCGCL